MLNQNTSHSPFERLTPEDVEREYKISRNTQKAQRWARTHRKPSMNWGPEFEKAGRKVLYRRSAVESWLAQGSAKADQSEQERGAA